MLLDKLSEFADVEALTGEVGTFLVGNAIKLPADPNARDLGDGEPIYLVIQTNTQILTAGDPGSVSFALASAAEPSLIASESARIHFQTDAFVTSDANEEGSPLDSNGVIACVALPREGREYERYLGVTVTVADAPLAAGQVDAFLTRTPSKWRTYADGI